PAPARRARVSGSSRFARRHAARLLCVFARLRWPCSDAGAAVPWMGRGQRIGWRRGFVGAVRLLRASPRPATFGDPGRTGGGDRLAEAARAQLRIQHEVRAQQGRTVLSARIVAAAPLVALVGLRATNPRYLSIFDSVAGQMVLIGCAVSVGLGYVAMLYFTRLPSQ